MMSMFKRNLSLFFAPILSLSLVFPGQIVSGQEIPVWTKETTGTQDEPVKSETDIVDSRVLPADVSATDPDGGIRIPEEQPAVTETSGDYIYTVTDGEAAITGFNKIYSGILNIPSILGGYPVTNIGDRAFFECSGLTSISIPDSVTSIGDFAFSYCSGLTSVAFRTE